MSTQPPRRADDAGHGRRNGALDLLRLVGALAVVVYHWAGEPAAVEWAFYAGPDTLFPHLHRGAAYGYLGVNLFFVISGAVIATSAIGRTPSTFLTARASRLIPALVVSSLIVTALVLFSPFSIVKNLRFGQIVAGWLLLNYPLKMPDFSGVYWTLWYEVRFYLLIATAILLCRRPTRRHFLICAYLWLLFLVVVVGSSSMTGLIAGVVMPDYGALFVAGMLIGLAPDAPGRRAVALPLVVATVLATFTPGATRIQQLVILMSVGAVAYASWGRGLALLDRNSVATIGKMTYPIYLLEGAPSLALLRYQTHVGVGRGVALAVAFASVFGSAWVITRFIDPVCSRKIREWLDPEPAAPQVAPSASGR
jgi:peptidoglycan/LPS O-acetylase OafA/YrhL